MLEVLILWKENQFEIEGKVGCYFRCNRVYGTCNIDLKDASGWDGTFNSRDVVPGVYVYRIEVILDDETKVFFGDISLMR